MCCDNSCAYHSIFHTFSDHHVRCGVHQCGPCRPAKIYCCPAPARKEWQILGVPPVFEVVVSQDIPMMECFGMLQSSRTLRRACFTLHNWDTGSPQKLVIISLLAWYTGNNSKLVMSFSLPLILNLLEIPVQNNKGRSIFSEGSPDALCRLTDCSLPLSIGAADWQGHSPLGYHLPSWQIFLQ